MSYNIETTYLGFHNSYLYYHVWWRRERQPTLVFLPGEAHGQRSLVGYSQWGRKDLDTTEQLTKPIHVWNRQLIGPCYIAQGAQFGALVWPGLGGSFKMEGIYVCVSAKSLQLCSTHGLYSPLLCPWDFPGKNTGVGCRFLIQDISMHIADSLHCAAETNTIL